MKKILAFVLSAALFVAGLPRALGEGPQPIEWMLSRVPQQVFTDGHLSFVDYQALVALQPGAAAPVSALEAQAHLETPQGQAYLRAMQGARGGFHGLLRYLMLAEEMAVQSGLDPYAVAQSMTLGELGLQVLFRGPVDEKALEAALKAKGYQLTEPSGEMPLWCQGGICDKGYEVDLSKRDPAFLFGGDLGRFWPVAWMEGLVAASPEEANIRAIAARQGPMLSQMPQMQALLQAVTLPDGHTSARLAQLMTWPSPFQQEQPGLLAIGQAYTQQALWVVVTLPWSGPGDEATMQAAKGWAEHASLTRAGPDSLDQALAQWGGVLESPRLVTAQGATLLALPFRFPVPQEAAQPLETALSLPFQWLVDAVWWQDLGWLPR